MLRLALRSILSNVSATPRLSAMPGLGQAQEAQHHKQNLFTYTYLPSFTILLPITCVISFPEPIKLLMREAYKMRPSAASPCLTAGMVAVQGNMPQDHQALFRQSCLRSNEWSAGAAA